MHPQPHAPDAESMIQACQDAFRHHRQVGAATGETRMLVDGVPHFVPGMGASGEWYRVGALHLIATDHYLTVYLDAVTGQVQVEQALMDVVSGTLTRRQDDRAQFYADTPDRDRWENEGGAASGQVNQGSIDWPKESGVNST